jgi:hypothetical protein
MAVTKLPGQTTENLADNIAAFLVTSFICDLCTQLAGQVRLFFQ